MCFSCILFSWGWIGLLSFNAIISRCLWTKTTWLRMNAFYVTLFSCSSNVLEKKLVSFHAISSKLIRKYAMQISTCQLHFFWNFNCWPIPRVASTTYSCWNIISYWILRDTFYIPKPQKIHPLEKFWKLSCPVRLVGIWSDWTASVLFPKLVELPNSTHSRSQSLIHLMLQGLRTNLTLMGKWRAYLWSPAVKNWYRQKVSNLDMNGIIYLKGPLV